ncbi:nucleotidyltransferase domain-containing protein [uncultured Dokdonia sp.]|uniref:nucleotidyltransferase domain-containing protein n=1 Tax=uncultured Dokdonia sp. TaxID=575653 RepID=UPI00262AF423|nr:nucleotidyltransferase domain-containing protein [uncultured Dokdonia sp.]
MAFSDAKESGIVEQELETLTKEGIIYKINGFYSCDNDMSQVERRLEGNEGARNIAKKADRMSRLISKFPFVEGVGISGALSKGFFDKDGDIDFFIITSKQRLWVARTLLILYKKIFLLNSKKYFCVNYFISENSLEIEEKNLFTATELVTLIPMYGNGSFKRFYDTNAWAYTTFPNRNFGEGLDTLKPIKKPRFTRFAEKILSSKIGEQLDTFFLKLTYKKWKMKFSEMNPDQFNVAMKSTKSVSKHHPQGFQNKVITRLNEKYITYENKYNITLNKEHA